MTGFLVCRVEASGTIVPGRFWKTESGVKAYLALMSREAPGVYRVYEYVEGEPRSRYREEIVR